MSAITSLPSGVGGGSLNLISTQTASSSSTIDFTSGIDSTYKEYIFKFYDIHPATSSVLFTFQADTGTNTNYNQTITSTNFRAKHTEADGGTGVEYRTARDQAQGTAFQQISEGIENDNDSSLSGTLHLFDPSNTTFVKHFISRCNGMIVNPGTQETYCAGYFNTTTALTRVQFKFSSGNIDSGVIKLYGVS
jgi:hypothetical protein